MIFIFGYHPITKQIGPIEEKCCPNCNNTRHWVLAKSTYFISLFFLPIIPTKTRRYSFCPVCNFDEALRADDFAQKQGLARLNKEALNKNMSQAEYDERLKSL